MRLIDADALKEKAVHYSETEYHFDHYAVEVDDIDDAPTIEPASPWHRVEEDLPKEDGKYLVYMFTSAWRWEFKFAGYLHGRWIGAGGGDVRYWMPIEPPKEESK